MLGWAVAIGTGLVAGVAVGMLLRRQKALYAWLRGEITGLRDDIVQARCDLRALATPRGRDILDEVECEDYEIANNLDRMNFLLDQLNSLLKGKSPDALEDRRVVYREELPLCSLDFTSPEEFRRFESLPPISEEEIQDMDWDYLFRRIASEDDD